MSGLRVRRTGVLRMDFEAVNIGVDNIVGGGRRTIRSCISCNNRRNCGQFIYN